MLDGVGNPHNLGAIARTAAFFGVPRIVRSDYPAQAKPSDASYRVAEGGLGYVELYRCLRFAEMLRELRGSFRIVAAATDKGRSISALRRGKRPFASILGNEERGLPRAARDMRRNYHDSWLWSRAIAQRCGDCCNPPLCNSGQLNRQLPR